ncbi:hypothetical protein SBA4_3880004 [Candidatus Sulfopaludibacter sp. SbA4]|nr:hypothetical protein SBA4_3880004 [Candidatus Sulfopaludibacter sp. SbA4]
MEVVGTKACATVGYETVIMKWSTYSVRFCRGCGRLSLRACLRDEQARAVAAAHPLHAPNAAALCRPVGRFHRALRDDVYSAEVKGGQNGSPVQVTVMLPSSDVGRTRVDRDLPRATTSSFRGPER